MIRDKIYIVIRPVLYVLVFLFSLFLGTRGIYFGWLAIHPQYQDSNIKYLAVTCLLLAFFLMFGSVAFTVIYIADKIRSNNKASSDCQKDTHL